MTIVSDLLTLLVLSIPTITGIQLTCYSSARLVALENGSLHYNLTLQSCQCMMIQQNMSGFQYDRVGQTCYVFKYNPLTLNLRVTPDSKVCFINRTTVVSSDTTAGPTTLPPSPLNVSTSESNSNYFTSESLSISTTAVLTSLTIVVTVPKTFGVTYPDSYVTFPDDTVNKTIVQTSDTVQYICQLMNGRTIPPGQWQFTVQFNLNGTFRSTHDDTYMIQMQSYQPIYGHF